MGTAGDKDIFNADNSIARIAVASFTYLAPSIRFNISRL